MRRHVSRAQWPLKSSPLGEKYCQGSLAKVVKQNIEAVEEYRLQAESQKTFQDHLADLITKWSGSMMFVYLHVVWFGVWIAINLGWLGIEPFDPFPYGLLTTIVSLEAIFLSTFVLVSQNRQAGLADRRSELDLQINLLAEYEMTRVLSMVDAIAKKLGVENCDTTELEELEKDVAPKELLEELEQCSGAKPNHKSPKK